MGMRLGFSVAVAVDPDVLIIDEVFAVGDMHFQKKCVDAIHSFRDRGKTILFCSHGLYNIRQLCDDALWIQQGRIAADGDATVVTNEYAAYQRSRSFNAAEIVEENIPQAAGDRSRFPRIESVRVCRPGTDEEIYKIAPGAAIDVKVAYFNPDPSGMPVHLGIGFLRSDQTLVTASTTQFAGKQVTGRSGQVTMHIPRVLLLSGSFVVFAVLLDERGIHRYDNGVAEQDLVVLNRGKELGLFLQDHSWTIEQSNGKP
jgi:lipopolysaccharide transport system ATP-binding protein